MSNMRSLWRGELSLSDAFWNWAVFGGLIVNIVSSALFLWLIMSDYPILALIAGYAFPVPYNFMVCVGVWRSADRYSGDPRQANLARIVTTVGMILLSVT
jgi:hypothetical protein